MACATYLVRIAGYWLAGRIHINHAVETWLRYLPGCILTSLVAPFIVRGNWIEAIAALLTVLVMWFTRNLFLAMVTGIGFVALGTWLTPFLS